MNPRFSYREAAVRGASPLRLVILLYEQAIEDLRRALAAHGHNDIETRTREIKHALLVIGHLQSSLDKERGGQVAENLECFYGQIRMGLVEAQSKQLASLLEKQIALLMQVREAWCGVERVEQVAQIAKAVKTPVMEASPPAPAQAEGNPSSLAEWNA
jgi:flagellar secretion chaperone FliS